MSMEANLAKKGKAEIGGDLRGPAVTRGRPRSAGREPDRLATLDTALDLLKIVAANEGRTSLTELSHLSGQQPNKLQRYLATLKHHGFLVQSATTGLYDIGPESFALGMSALRRYDPMTGVQAAMSDVAATTGVSCNLYVWTTLGATLIMHEEGVHAFPVALKLGTALPLCQSATGLVFLALMPESETGELLERELETARSDGLEISMDYVRGEIETIRKSKIYWTNRAVITGTAAVLPLFSEDGTISCTITAILPRGYASSAVRDRLEAVLLGVRERFMPHGGSSDAGA